MATDATTRIPDEIDYPDGDGRPMAETPVHRQNLTDLIAMLMAHFLLDPLAYVSGNMFVYYERGNRYRCFAPDVFVVRGVDKERPRRVYKIWEEGRGPDLIIELTSVSTREEDIADKFGLYRDLRVPEYFLFDPLGEYLTPSLQGHRLVGDDYVPIRPVACRLPSEVLGLHLERDGQRLRLYNPDTGLWLPTPQEAREQAEAGRERAEAGRERERAERERAEAERDRMAALLDRSETGRRDADEARRRAEAEAEALRRELEALRRGQSGTP